MGKITLLFYHYLNEKLISSIVVQKLKIIK